MRLTKKGAEKAILEFLNAPKRKKDKYWDAVVPYANKYPELYVEIVTRGREKKEETVNENEKG